MLALSWVKNYAYDLCITNGRSEDPLKVLEPIDIYLHLPAGTTKKDGPSVGVAMVRSPFLPFSLGSFLSVRRLYRILIRGQSRLMHSYLSQRKSACPPTSR